MRAHQRLRCELLEDRTVPAVFDLNVTPVITINGASFSFANGTSGSNTTNFVSIQRTGVEQGYNTGGATEFDTKQTSALNLASVPTISMGGTLYREFLL